MNRSLLAGAAIAAVLASAVVGYRIGTGQWPSITAVSVVPAPPSSVTANRTVLYWKHPDGTAEYAPTATKAADGRDFLPVYGDEEKGFGGNPTPSQHAKSDRKPLYYRNPMGLPDTSPVPKKDWMGMDYIPVYEGEVEGGTTVKVSLDKVQRAGVRTEEARMVAFARPVHAPGIAKPDERTLRVITLRADAFIETLYVNEKGRHVKAGEPLFRVYSPDFLRALVEAKSSAIAGVIGAEQKLKILGIPPEVIAEAKRSKEIAPSFDYSSPASGIVMEKLVVEGMMIRMGEPLYRLVDLSSIWVIASVAEQDLGEIKIGDPAKVRFKALPADTFDGKVIFILHELDKDTRTASVRIEVKNPDHRIKHEMYADVEIDAGAGEMPHLAVPAQAVIDSGDRQVVLVARGEGRFEPRAVRIGRQGGRMIEITDGLKAGESVVTSANFLIDAESNLKAALAAFTVDAPQPMPDASEEPAR
ncbi:efflux RND transporter periplasmic adaptor subunit [uncultured Hyphomicrobium sp.]|jgi:Cu(I)/Ag(I) efflux system membrane fusion protein|uniref:efflux RND transporter periplasmic adaptor subunit n=1 Tax=uncultured Hyphomicrobium sp. TaxID=194373 RepID=UPI0025DDE778|nr:efflux RND transporter periplasmic adaptor subunit [uncultured Hyphomicrobium sp.]